MKSIRLLCALFLTLLCLVASAKEKELITIWGLSVNADDKGTDAIVRAFEEKYPQYKLRVLGMGAGSGNPQKLMTAIVGHAPPDLIRQDRFTVHDWASRGAFMPLNSLIARDAAQPDCPRESDYYPAAWDEGVYEGQVYCIPLETDIRVFYWNKDVFAEKADALRKAGLDPNRPPRTWSELSAYNKVLTEFNPDGSLSRMGFSIGAFDYYGFLLQNDGSYLSPDGATATFDNPRNLEALKFIDDLYKTMGGYAKADTYGKNFGYDKNNAFVEGKVAMMITGEWELGNWHNIKPTLNIGAAPPPVPDDRYNHFGRFANVKNTFATWIGGFGWAIPDGAKHVDGAWEFVKFASSLEGRKINLLANEDLHRSKGQRFFPIIQGSKSGTEWAVKQFAGGDSPFDAAYKVHADAMNYAVARKSTFAASVIFDAQGKVKDDVLNGRATAAQASKEANDASQKLLNEFYYAKKLPVADMTVPFAILSGVVGAGILGFVIWIVRQVKSPNQRRETVAGYLFIAPWIIGFLVTTMGPMIASILLSFTVYNVLSPPHWIGIQNYKDIFQRDLPLLMKAFGNVFYMAGFGIPIGNGIGLTAALLLNQKVRGIRVFRTAFYLPAIVPGVAATILWIVLFTADPSKGLLASLWNSTIHPWFGVPTPTWLDSAEWARPSILLMGAWGAGSGFILWLAGLKGISQTLYEAADIDGATTWQRFKNITIPQLSPLIFFNLIMAVIGSIQAFDTVFLVTRGSGGGPGDVLLMPVLFLFQQGFSYFRMGYASALAWFLFAIILVLTGINLQWGKLWVHSETK